MSLRPRDRPCSAALSRLRYRSAGSGAGRALKHYLDSSVVLALLLEDSDALKPLQDEQQVGSSRLLWIEVARVIERAVRTEQLSEQDGVAVRRQFQQLSSGLFQLKLHEPVFARSAGSFPLLVRTLDAIHLASAELWLHGDAPSGLSVWTLDQRMNLCAASLGFATPLETS
ncbi:MAG: PIN domain-containing protein [Spirochaetaceae bacterium]|nr:MAG: PIN domain-containing protein [Spirochaetaceae bacterium]